MIQWFYDLNEVGVHRNAHGDLDPFFTCGLRTTEGKPNYDKIKLQCASMAEHYMEIDGYLPFPFFVVNIKGNQFDQHNRLKKYKSSVNNPIILGKCLIEPGKLSGAEVRNSYLKQVSVITQVFWVIILGILGVNQLLTNNTKQLREEHSLYMNKQLSDKKTTTI